MSTAWLYYHGVQAGLDMRTIHDWPMGFVLDVIACWQIERRGNKEKKRAGGSLADQMAHYYGR